MGLYHKFGIPIVCLVGRVYVAIRNAIWGK